MLNRNMRIAGDGAPLKNGDRLKIIAEVSVLQSNELELLVAPLSKISPISQLRGKTISVTATKGSTSWRTWTRARHRTSPSRVRR